jgi:peptidoglycan/xylan/chitin deacetylase (PgdA/CDA1 family)
VTPRLRQMVLGLLIVPLSVLPFVAYGSWTPEGRFLVDRISARLDPPGLPVLDAGERAHARALAPMYAGHVLPLVYHGIGSMGDGDGTGEGDFVVSPETFAEHLAVLRAAGMQFVTARDVATAFDGGPPLPDRAVMITFDDGRSDALLWATPLLEEAGAVATMFVISDRAESPGAYYASWDELDHPDVWDLESHTADLHEMVDVDGEELPTLTARLEGETLAEWRRRVRADLDRADARIAERTGRRPVAFAYPFGAWGGDRTNDPALAPLLRHELARRYELAFHQDDQDTVELSGPGSARLGWRRLEVGDWSGIELLRHISAAASRTWARALGATGPAGSVPSGDAAVP